MEYYAIKINGKYLYYKEEDTLDFVEYTDDLQKAAIWDRKSDALAVLQIRLNGAKPNTIYSANVVKVKQVWVEEK